MFRTVMFSTCKHINKLSNVRQFSQAVEMNRLEKTMNQVILLGRTGGDPQMRGNEQHPVVVFSLATHTNYKYENGEYLQRTDWHRICVFKPNVRENVYNYLKKGQRVMVNGRISYGEIKDEEGNTKSTATVIADDVIFFHDSKKQISV